MNIHLGRWMESYPRHLVQQQLIPLHQRRLWPQTCLLPQSVCFGQPDTLDMAL
jgi:hypothetical protein